MIDYFLPICIFCFVLVVAVIQLLIDVVVAVVDVVVERIIKCYLYFLFVFVVSMWLFCNHLTRPSL